MALEVALALSNLIDGDHRRPENYDMTSLISNGARISILTHGNGESTDLHDLLNANSTNYAILNGFSVLNHVKAKRFEDGNEIRLVRKNGQPLIVKKYAEADSEKTSKLESPDTNDSNTLWYQNRNLLDLAGNMRSGWMSFSAAELNRNKMSVEEFLRNRGQISRIADTWPPPHQLKTCPISDCKFSEQNYQ